MRSRQWPLRSARACARIWDDERVNFETITALRHSADGDIKVKSGLFLNLSLVDVTSWKDPDDVTFARVTDQIRFMFR